MHQTQDQQVNDTSNGLPSQPQDDIPAKATSQSCLNSIFDGIFVISIKSRNKTFALTEFQLNSENISFKYWEGHSISDGYSLNMWYKFRDMVNSTLKLTNHKPDPFLLNFNSIYKTKNIFFLRLTQVDVIKYAVLHNYSKILMLEDDILLSNPDLIRRFCETEHLLPEWMVLNLGTSQKEWKRVKFLNHKNITTISDKDGFTFFHLNGASWGAYAISFAKSSYKMVLDLFDIDFNATINKQSKPFFLRPFDSYHQMKVHFPRNEEGAAGKIFGLYPPIIAADVSSSTLRNARDEKKWMDRRHYNVSHFSKYWNVRFKEGLNVSNITQS